MNKSLRRSSAALITTAFVVPATILSVATPASAVGASCTAVRQSKSQIGLDHHRARVICTRINSDTKVRAKLIRDGAKDYTSSWFTTEDKYYYTGYATCYAGCRAVYEVAAR
jgi:hypothetical protein